MHRKIYDIEEIERHRKDGPPVPQPTMMDIIKCHGDHALGGDRIERTAEAWQRTWRFTPEEAKAWLDVLCFDPGTAAAFRTAGITPREAGTLSRGKSIAWLVCKGTMSYAEAVGFVEDVRRHEGEAERLRAMAAVITEHGDLALQDNVFAHAEETWRGAGFTPRAADRWLRAGCFSAEVARGLAERFEPEPLAMAWTMRGEKRTLAYWLCEGSLEEDQAAAVLKGEGRLSTNKCAENM